ncbi:geobacillin-26 family protein [Lysinibacillus sphaericus]|uniref:geobacillin-26 family protein n=1 Tax=Lysinibacillus sphaericus TaxID=1421 RepID=UPI003F7AFABC
MKLVTKVVAFVTLCFFTVILPIGTTQASELTTEPQTLTFKDGTTATILVDNEDETVAETSDANNIYIATNDKQENTITIETYDLDRNLLSTDVVDGNKAYEEDLFNYDPLSEMNVVSDNIMPFAAAKSNYELLQETSLQGAYGYWIYGTSSGEIWVIKMKTGVTKSTFYSGANKTHFKDFKGSVDTFMSYKDQIVTKVGAGGIGLLAGLYLVPEPTWTKVAAGLLTIIASAWVYAEGKAMWAAYDDSKLYYSRVKE